MPEKQLVESSLDMLGVCWCESLVRKRQDVHPASGWSIAGGELAAGMWWGASGGADVGM